MNERTRFVAVVVTVSLAASFIVVSGAPRVRAVGPNEVTRDSFVTTLPAASSYPTSVVPWTAPATGVVVFRPTAPAYDVFVVGATESMTLRARVAAGVTYDVQVRGSQSGLSDPTEVSVFWALTGPSDADSVGNAALLVHRNGSVVDSTRAATIEPAEPLPFAPVKNARATVWYRWTAQSDADERFSVSPGGSDANDDPPGWDLGTTVGVAVFLADDVLSQGVDAEPLATGGDCAYVQDRPGIGGQLTIPVVTGRDYLVQVSSCDGAGAQSNDFALLSMGAFTLTWSGTETAPHAQDDVVVIGDGSPTIDVLANDSDAEADLLSVVSFDSPTAGGSVERDSTDSNLLVYTPPPGFQGADSFGYVIDDGQGSTAHATVTVYVAMPAGTIVVTPPSVDFGPTPLGRVAVVAFTITNVTTSPIGPFVFTVFQDTPSPFDVSDLSGTCVRNTLQSGASCAQNVRFFSVPDADAASPATLFIGDQSTNTVSATLSLTGATAPAVSPDAPNTAPVAVDDLAAVAPGFVHTLPALDNDTDADGDALTITAVSTSSHGTTAIVPCRDVRNENCIQYRPDDGYLGVDQIFYTIADSRGATASAVFWLRVGNGAPAPMTVNPSRGPSAGGQIIVVTGEIFTIGTELIFECNGINGLATTTSLTPNRMEAITPPLPPGVCDIVALDRFAARGTLLGAYRVNAAPHAADDTATVAQDDVLTQTAPGLLSNDTDPDGDALSVSLVVGPAHGTLTLDTTPGAFDYRPAAGFAGVDSFTYRAFDSEEYSNTATVTITVTPPAIAPAFTSVDHATFLARVFQSFTVNTIAAPTAVISTSSVLPDGLELTDLGDGRASLSGAATLQNAGTYSIVLDASNGVAPDAHQTFTLTVVVDTTPPDTTLTSTPTDPTSRRDATFGFSSEPGAFFFCALDGALVAPCTSPKTYQGLSLGHHDFSVFATDSAANADQSPATYQWTIAPVEITLSTSTVPSHIPEPGGQDVHHAVNVHNASPDPVTIATIVDNTYGDLSGRGTCAAGVVITPGSDFGCSFPTQVVGDAGSTFTDTVTVAVFSATGLTGSATATATVTVDDVAPSITVSAVTSPAVVPFGGDGTFVVTVTNRSVEAVALGTLSSDVYGDLNGQGNCSLPVTIAVGTDYQCSFTAPVTGPGGSSQPRTFMADATDNEHNHASASKVFTVSIGPAPTTISVDTAGLAAPTVVGQAYRVHWHVAPILPATGIPTGTVEVSGGSGCSAFVDTGECSVTSTDAGPTTLHVAYLGDSGFAAAAVDVSHDVNPALTTTTITSDQPDPSSVGQPYTVAWSVAVTTPGAGTPTGTVVVSDGASSCSAEVSTGACSLVSVSVGTKTLTVAFAPGDGRFVGSNATANHDVKAVTLTSVTPSAGARGVPHLTVHIKGGGFITGASVTVPGGGVTVTSTTFTDPFDLTADVSVGVGAALGARDVQVRNPGGVTATCSGCFAVNPQPTVTALTPGSLPQGASRVISIAGTAFQAAAIVSFSGAGIAINSVLVTPTTITVAVTVAPGAAPGARQVTVTNPDGGSATRAGLFRVNALPTIGSVNPNSIVQGGTTSLTISGSGYLADFVANGSVSFGPGVAVDSVTLNNGLKLTVKISVDAAAAPGSRDVVITNPDHGAVTCTGCLTIDPPPSITPPVPPNGLPPGAVRKPVVVGGNGFQNGAKVSFSGTGITVLSTTVIDSSHLSAVVSIATVSLAGARDITVTNLDGGRATCAGCFTINPLPSIASLSPSTLGRGASHQLVTVTGTGFQSGTALSVSGNGVTVHAVTWANPTTLIVELSVGSSATKGNRSVTVTNPDGGSVTKLGALAVT